MTKNHISIVKEDDTEDASQLARVLAERPAIPLSPHEMLTARDALWALDIMKKGLVQIRGGSKLKDKAFIVLDNNLDTEYFTSIMRPSIETLLIQPGKCSRFFQSLFYDPVRKREVRVEVEEGGALRGEKVSKFTSEEVNKNYLPGRSILCVPMDSASSAVYLTLAYLELVLDSFSATSLADIKSSVVWEAYSMASSWKVEDFVRNAKYITAYPLAKFLQQEDLPERPKSLTTYVFFKGAIAKIIRARLISRRDHKAARFFFGLLQGVKRACNVVPMVYIKQSKEKHLLTLTSPSKSVDQSYLGGEFTKLNHKLWNGVSIDARTILTFTEPSKSASFEAGRQDGGQDAIVREAFGMASKPDPDQYPTSPDESVPNVQPDVIDVDPQEWMDFMDEENSEYEWVDSANTLYGETLKTMSFYDELYSMVETNEGVKELRGQRLTYEEKRVVLNELYKAHKASALPIKCSIVPLSEPLKVRIISAGEGLPYYMAKPFQKTIWKWLRRFPQFTVIGEPLTPDILSKMLDREALLQRHIDQMNSQRKSWKSPIPDYPRDFFVSGDYSAATDNLKIEYTLQCFDTLEAVLLAKCKSEYGQDLPILVAYFTVMRALLQPHTLQYADSDGLLKGVCDTHKIPYEEIFDALGKRFIRVLQQNGQLMGSPISFPFLCAINFVCYWTSVNRYLGCHVPHRLLPVLVNGDDILFRSNVAHYAIWKEVIKEVGFTLSLGKNYTHTNYLTINSELFEYRVRPDGEEFLKLDYFNVGLLIAQSKGRLADPRRKLSLLELYKCSVGCALNKPQAHVRFMHYNKMQLDEATDRGKFNCFLPIQYGGLGFPVYDELKTEIYVTNFQRRFASFLEKRTNEQLEQGIYPKKYYAALLTDTTPLQSLVRRHGCPEMKMSRNQYEAGWKIFTPSAVTTMGPLSAVSENSGNDPLCEYRLPARSLLKEFNKDHFVAFHTPEGNYMSVEKTNDELLSSQPLLIWVRDLLPRVPPLKTWLPS